MELTPDQIRLARIFFPYAFERRDALLSKGTRLVHYTLADAAVNMLQKKEIWMRKTSCMDDFMEVEHGIECLQAAYRGEGGKRFKAALESAYKGISKEIEDLFNGWMPRIETDTYLTCLSEHVDREDTFGRLSMWRAYGEKTGVALVLNNTPFLNPSDALKAYTSPVAYMTDKEVEVELGKIAGVLENNLDFLRAQSRQEIVGYVFNAFKIACLCTKHPGFQEEREWRVVYSPTLEKSDHLIKEIQVI